MIPAVSAESGRRGGRPKRKSSEVEMIEALKQMEAGQSAAGVGRELGVSKPSVCLESETCPLPYGD